MSEWAACLCYTARRETLCSGGGLQSGCPQPRKRKRPTIWGGTLCERGSALLKRPGMARLFFHFKKDLGHWVVFFPPLSSLAFTLLSIPCLFVDSSTAFPWVFRKKIPCRRAAKRPPCSPGCAPRGCPGHPTPAARSNSHVESAPTVQLRLAMSGLHRRLNRYASAPRYFHRRRTC